MPPSPPATRTRLLGRRRRTLNSSSTRTRLSAARPLLRRLRPASSLQLLVPFGGQAEADHAELLPITHPGLGPAVPLSISLSVSISSCPPSPIMAPSPPNPAMQYLPRNLANNAPQGLQTPPDTPDVLMNIDDSVRISSAALYGRHQSLLNTEEHQASILASKHQQPLTPPYAISAKELAHKTKSKSQTLSSDRGSWPTSCHRGQLEQTYTITPPPELETATPHPPNNDSFFYHPPFDDFTARPVDLVCPRAPRLRDADDFSPPPSQSRFGTWGPLEEDPYKDYDMDDFQGDDSIVPYEEEAWSGSLF
jgi:hypothetical protein